MEVPKPVNLAALSGILAKSKQVMAQVEAKKPVKQTGNMVVESDSAYDTYDVPNNNYPSHGYSEDDEKAMMFEDYTPKQSSFDPNNVGNYTDEQVMSSNLPPMIKEAMLKHRIPKLMTPPSKFTAEDISKLTGAPIKQPQQQQRQPISEARTPSRQTADSDLITVSKAQLQEMIDEGISRFFKQVYNKTLTEETIRKTVNLLIKEGRMTPMKKTK
jgi:hypothetical protein